MSVVSDLKAKLEKKFGNEFVDKDDDQMNVGRREQTTEERVAADAEHEASINAYLETDPKKKRMKSVKKQSNKQMLVMKNQDMNPLDENFQLKNLTKPSDRYVMELGSNHYDKVGNKSKVAYWGYDHNKNMWLITRETRHMEYYAKESQFETWMKLDLQSLLCAPYHD
ncbi:hypothetical protein Hdeb2414_s0007g00238681 [Helianthus debilis subsp. tardiflorus]